MSQGESEYLNNVSGYTSEVLWEIAEDQWRRATDDREFGPPEEQHTDQCGCADCLVARPQEVHPDNCDCDDCGGYMVYGHLTIRYPGLREKVKQARKRKQKG